MSGHRDPAVSLDDAANSEIVNAMSELLELTREATNKQSVSAVFPQFIAGIAFIIAFFNNGCDGKQQLHPIVTAPLRDATLLQIHRTFLSGAHIFFEEAAHTWCNANSIQVVSRRAAKLQELTEKLKDRIEPATRRELAKLVDKRPNSVDLLNAIFDNTSRLGHGARWRKFFDDFTIVRNHVSHSKNALTEGQLKSLQEGDFNTWLNGEFIRIGIAHYPVLLRQILLFFDWLEYSKATHALPANDGARRSPGNYRT